MGKFTTACTHCGNVQEFWDGDNYSNGWTCHSCGKFGKWGPKIKHWGDHYVGD